MNICVQVNDIETKKKQQCLPCTKVLVSKETVGLHRLVGK